ncbi:MAG: serine hydrolase domain-containing protein [Chlorobiaceae bacterium]
MQSLRCFIVSYIILASLHTVFTVKAVAFDFRTVDAVMEKAVNDAVFPGASLAVLYKDKIVFHKAFGRMTYDSQSLPADTTTIYDLASLTKPIVTTSITMQLVERDSLILQDPVSKYLPDFTGNGKENITIEHLLRHTSGLRAHTVFSKTCATPEELFKTIAADTLLAAPGSTTLYSDLGFMLLGKVIETITQHSLATNFHNRFTVPLGMHSTMFNPPSTIILRIAPVERDEYWPFSRTRPLVHDQNAALLGGVAGHAGLYSTTGDLLCMVKMVMHGGSSNNRIYFRKETLRKFLSKNNSARALGWDLRSLDGRSSAGDFFSRSSYGHLGFTGTSIWIDPEKELAVILLSNRVYPTSNNIKIRSFRPLLHNTIATCLGLKITTQ